MSFRNNDVSFYQRINVLRQRHEFRDNGSEDSVSSQHKG